MNAAAGTTEAVRVRSIQNDELRKLAVGALVVVGVALLVLGGVVWLDTTAPGKSTVEKTSTTGVTKVGETTTTSVRSKDTTTPGASSIRSEAVAGTLFALGALVFLCGIFFSRISEVTLPGGAGLKLDPQTQAKVAAKVTEKARQTEGMEPDPGTVSRLYEATIQELARRALGTFGTFGTSGGWSGGQYYPSPPAGDSGTSPGDDAIAEAVDVAAERVAPRSGAAGG